MYLHSSLHPHVVYTGCGPMRRGPMCPWQPLGVGVGGRVRGTRLPLGERAQILRKSLVERHLVAGTLLCGALLGRCRSLLPLGDPVCASVLPRLFFAARHKVMLQLTRLARLVGLAPAGACPHAAATG